jgi:CRP/FNR family transcriptional regulator
MDINRFKELFPGLETALYDEIFANASVKEFKAGETVIRVGQPIRSTMLVMEGTIKLYREDDEGNEFFIYYLNAGQACSLSLVCALKQETSELLAIAVTDAVLISIPLNFMEQWMAKYKTWYQFVIESYRDRFEELLKTIDAIAFSNMDERLEFYIKKQVSLFGPILRITHQQIANDLNSSREVISRLMKKMEAKKWLLIHRNGFEWVKA